MKKIRIAVSMLTCLLFTLFLLPSPCNAVADTLAQQINDVLNAVNWNILNDYYWATVHYGQVFSRLPETAFDSLLQSYAQLGQWYEVLHCKRLSEIDGYNSDTVDSYTRQALTNQIMLSYVPQTYSGQFLVYHRFTINGYRYAEEMNCETTKWDKNGAYQDFARIWGLTNNVPFLLCNPATNSFIVGRRYYDESAETLSCFLKLYLLGVNDASSKAQEVRQYIEDNFWGPWEYYPYTVGSSQVECEIAFHTIIGELYATIGNLSGFPEHNLADINYKLLVNGWNSKLWSPGGYCIRHAESNPQRRLQNTLNAFTVLHTYYLLFDDDMKSAFIQLLTGAPKAWQGLLQSGLYEDSSKLFRESSGREVQDYCTTWGAMLLFLDGIIPSTGSLAIPLNDERYEDTESMFPATHFRFNYDARQIRIPVNKGELKFQFGSTVTAFTFPSNGIYEIQFGNDWNSITSTNKVENLEYANYKYLTVAGPSTDIYPPTISLLSPQNKTYYSNAIPLTFETDEPVSWIGYSLDNQPNVTITGNTVINVEDGLHHIKVYANDTSGNMGSSAIVYFTVKPWRTSFIGLGGYPIVDFAVYNEKLYAAADNTLYMYDGSSWSIIDAPIHMLSLEPYEDKLIIGGKNGLYLYDGTAFSLIFTVPNYVKPLGVYNNTLYAGTVLDKTPTLYYCNDSAENPDNWHTDTAFSTILNFLGPFGSIDSLAVYNNNMYVTSGGTVYSYNGTDWSITKTYEDVCAYLDMKVYNGKLYLATRDQAWRKPIYQGYSGFSGRVVEFDGNNWTTVFDHDYWIYSLETYADKLYVGTANKIYTYDGTQWETSFNTAEGAYYAISFISFNNTIYAGMGNGYILADPTIEKVNPKTTAVPEFPSIMLIPLFMVATVLAVIVYRRKHAT